MHKINYLSLLYILTKHLLAFHLLPGEIYARSNSQKSRYLRMSDTASTQQNDGQCWGDAEGRKHHILSWLLSGLHPQGELTQGSLDQSVHPVSVWVCVLDCPIDAILGLRRVLKHYPRLHQHQAQQEDGWCPTIKCNPHKCFDMIKKIYLKNINMI